MGSIAPDFVYTEMKLFHSYELINNSFIRIFTYTIEKQKQK